MSLYVDWIRKQLRDEIAVVRQQVAQLSLYFARQGSTGRTDLGLGDSATKNVGTTAGTVAAGDDSRLAGGVPSSRQVISGTGLTGGGDLTADRTLAVSYGTSSTTAAVGNDSRITGAVQSGRQVISGTGLSGGGDLSADRTLAVSYGTSAGTAAQGNDSRITGAAPLASPTFTGTPAAPTASTDTSSTQIATTAYVKAQRSRLDLCYQAAGYLAENFPFELNSAQTTLATGLVIGALVGLRAGDVINGVVLCTATAGAGTAPTGFYVGLADSTGTVVAASSNLASSTNLTTANQMALYSFSSGYTVTASAGYRLLVLQNGAFATTPVQFTRQQGLQNAAQAKAYSTGLRRLATYGSSITSLSVSDSLGAAGNTATIPWMAAA